MASEKNSAVAMTANNPVVRIVHWARSVSKINPFEGVSYDSSSNTGGCGLSGRIEGVWAMPDTSGLRNKWCCGTVESSGREWPARDIRVTAEVPLARLRLFVQGTEKVSWDKTDARKAMVIAGMKCGNDDNGLVVDHILPEEVVDVSFGEWVQTQEKDAWGDPIERVEITPLDRSYF